MSDAHWDWRSVSGVEGVDDLLSQFYEAITEGRAAKDRGHQAEH